jgi:hypothetical protein
MLPELQKSLIFQTWRVLDVISPPLYGPIDFKNCSHTCCGGLIQCKGTRKSPNCNDFSFLFPDFKLFNEFQTVTEDEMIYENEMCSMRVKTFEIPSSYQPGLSFTCLCYGDSCENMTLINVKMKVKVFILNIPEQLDREWIRE